MTTYFSFRYSGEALHHGRGEIDANQYLEDPNMTKRSPLVGAPPLQPVTSSLFPFDGIRGVDKGGRTRFETIRV